MSARLLLILLLASGDLLAGQSAEREIGWIGLFTDDLLQWLENENRLNDLCGKPDPASEATQQCRADKLTPRLHAFPLWSGPSKTSGSAGALIVLATPGQGLNAFYADGDGGPAVGFEPDLFLADWGYGPYFHLTVVERRGGWIRLPEGPFPRETWLDARDLAPEPALLWLEPGEIVESPRGDLYILGIERRMVRARPEQAADMWCDSGDPPPIKPAPEIRLSPSDLYTSTGHLKLDIKYKKGC